MDEASDNNTRDGSNDSLVSPPMDEASGRNPPSRRSTRTKKPVDRFKFDKAHGYFHIKSIKRFINNTIKYLCFYHFCCQIMLENFSL